jgi:hypothetical protein
LFESSYECFCYIFLVVVSIDERDIDSIVRFAKTMPGLHPKPEGVVLECYYGDPYKMNVSGDYKTLWQRFWMCDNLTYDPKPGNMEVQMCKINDCVVQSHIKYIMMSSVKFVFYYFAACTSNV